MCIRDRFKQEVHQVQKEEIGQVQTRAEERCNHLDASVYEVKGTTTAHEEKIEEFRLRELRLQEEVNTVIGQTGKVYFINFYIKINTANSPDILNKELQQSFLNIC